MSDIMKNANRHHTKLNRTERLQLARWKEEGLSNGKCAQRLGRHRSTIGRELERNKWKSESRVYYEPLHAQWRTSKRKEHAWEAKHPLKSKHTYRCVMEKLREGWSPEQISDRLKLEHPDDPPRHICHETIYQFIYHPDNENKHLWEYLRRKQKKRRKKSGRKAHRSGIPDRVSIRKRPKEVDQRKEIGHWEGDSIVGKGKSHGLHTAYERYSSLIRIEKMDKLDAEESIKAQKLIYENLPKHLRKNTTLDNGREHVKHTELKKDLGMQTYFADPYSSWQRGGNENANLWIRYYFPKGTDFSSIPDEDIKDVEWELNDRPRKRLQFKKPIEVFAEHLPQELRS